MAHGCRRSLSRAATLAIVLLFAGAAAARATTWADSRIQCPLCRTTDEYAVVMSGGGYVYDWPSKEEFVFWPYIETVSVYCCRHCGYSQLMGEFEELPESRHAAVRQALRGVEIDRRYASYDEVPIALRLELAERVNAVLERDRAFWSHFNRVAGYHYERAGLPQQARVARRRALLAAEELRLSGDGRAKELLVISGSMRRATGEDLAALRDFAHGLFRGQSSEGLSAEESWQVRLYLDVLLLQGIGKIALRHWLGSALALGAVLAAAFRALRALLAWG